MMRDNDHLTELHQTVEPKPPANSVHLLRSSTPPAVMLALATATFIFDTITPYEIAAATFYVLVVLLAARIWQRREVIAVSTGCVVLTILSYMLTRHGRSDTGLANSAISLIAIGATTSLALRMQAAHAEATRAQAALARMARISTLGELAASIAHEVNQPLTAIAANASACQHWLNAVPYDPERTEASIAAIKEDAGRASAILARIRSLTSGGAPDRTWIDANRLILETVALLQHSVREQQIELRTVLAEGLPLIHADAVQFQQVILNLTINAVDAIEEAEGLAREVTISTRSEAAGKPMVVIVIQDTGVGFDPTLTGRMFDAFYTTKLRGIGIGLSLCRSIVESHGGEVTASARPGGGAILTVKLPAAVAGSLA